jgi:hypothetical protein
VTEQAYYRWSLLIPFLMGALWTLLSGSNPGERIMREFVLWFALGPYAVFALFLAIWTVEKPVPRIRKALLLSPLIYTLLVSLVAYPVVFLVFRARFGETVLTLAPFCLIIGYVCVGLVFALVVPLRAMRVLQ